MKSPCPLLMALVFFAAASAAHSQPAAPEQDAAPEKKKAPAYLRVRGMLFDEGKAVSVSLPQGGGEPRELLNLPKCERPVTTSYEEVPAENCDLAITRGEVAARLSANLDERLYYTLLIYPTGGKVAAKLLQDTFSPEAEKICRLRILNFGSERSAILSFPDGREITVGSGTLEEINLPQAGSVSINVKVPDPQGGHPAFSIMAIDTQTTPACSLVIMPDYRGRFRPRVWADGPQE